MTTKPMQHNIGAYLVGAIAALTTQAVAGSGNDNVWQNGLTIDLKQWRSRPRSCAVFFLAKTAGQQGGDKSSISIRMSDSPQGSVWTVQDTRAPVDQGLNDSELHQANFDLTGADDQIRFDWMVDLSAANTDTADFTAVVVFGGFQELPVLAGAGDSD